MEATVSPRVERKMVYAGVAAESFGQASDHLQTLANLEIKSERIRRATHRNGKQRWELRNLLEQAFLAKSIPEQLYGGPAEKDAPPIAVVMSDGGKYQLFDRKSDRASADAHWGESRIATLLSMTGQQHSSDPQVELPDFLQDVSIAQKLAEIGRIAGENPTDDSSDKEQQPPWERPEMLGKEVIASGKSWEQFGPMVASAAWYQGFAKATVKVFVSDGSHAIEKMQHRWFSDYTSVLDIMHALSYALAAARAAHDDQPDAWACYRRLATWIWQGNVDQAIEELDRWQERLGPAPAGGSESDPREIVRRSRVYYRNHRERMNYPEYRRMGYPLSSAIMESTVKQINRRVKGSEKFWSTEGGEAILGLRGDYLSGTRPLDAYWDQIAANANGQRNYSLSG